MELYTSEGCNSCPPADRWLRSLIGDAGLWERFVPIAFHVDYWDYIGWKDRFATPEFSGRQRAHAAAAGQRTIYTPGFLLNGKEWRAWRRWGAERGMELPPPSQRGNLTLVFNSGVAKVTFTPSDADAEVAVPMINVAVLGFGLTSQVRAGENRGRQLEHDFVALSLETDPLVASNGVYQGTLEVKVDTHGADRLALAAWVSNGANPAPLQAVGGWLPNGSSAVVAELN